MRRNKLAACWRCALCGHVTDCLPPQWEHLQVKHGCPLEAVMKAQAQGEHAGHGYTWRIGGVLVVERVLEKTEKRDDVLRCG